MSRTTDLMVNIYGNDKTASKTLKGVGREAESAGEHFKKMGKVAATSFLAVGGAAAALAVSSIKNAIEDEKSQRRLAIALKNTVGATKAQTASVEDYITKTQARYGVVDDKLRPSLQRLVTATKDVTEAQRLQTLAISISAGTGKDLETVSNALGKAYGGNLASLQRLGLGIDQSIIKSKDTKAAFELLFKTFDGQGIAAADSMEGRFGRLKIAMDETKEQIGYALMPIVEKMATYLTDTVVPNVQAFVDGLTGVTDGGNHAYDSVKKWGTEVRAVLKWIGDHKQVVIDIAAAMATFWAVGKIGSAVSTMVTAFKAINTVMAVTRGVAVSTAAAEAAASGGTLIAVQALAAGAVFAAFGLSNMWGGMKMPSAGAQTNKDINRVKSGDKTMDFSGSVVTTKGYDLNKPTSLFQPDSTKFYNGQVYTYDPVKKKYYVPDISGGRDYSVQPRAMGGPVARGASYIVGERGPELVTMGGNGFVTPNNRLGGLGGMTVIVNVAGSVIAEKDLAVTVRDSIAQLMRRRGLNPSILGV
jgi:hypothetical protein